MSPPPYSHNESEEDDNKDAVVGAFYDFVFNEASKRKCL